MHVNKKYKISMNHSNLKSFQTKCMIKFYDESARKQIPSKIQNPNNFFARKKIISEKWILISKTIVRHFRYYLKYINIAAHKI